MSLDIEEKWPSKISRTRLRETPVRVLGISEDLHIGEVDRTGLSDSGASRGVTTVHGLLATDRRVR